LTGGVYKAPPISKVGRGKTCLLEGAKEKLMTGAQTRPFPQKRKEFVERKRVGQTAKKNSELFRRKGVQ